MVIVYSGESSRAPNWSVDAAARSPSDAPPSESNTDSPPSEPFSLAGARALSESPAAPEADAAGWEDPELESGAQPLPSLRGHEVADRLTPLGPPWSEPAPALPVVEIAPAKREGFKLPSKASLAAGGAVLLAVVYFAFRGPEAEAPVPARPPAVAKVAKVESRAAESPPAREPAVEPINDAAPQPVLPEPAAPAPAPPRTAARSANDEPVSPSAKAATAKAPAGSTRVRLQVFPADAKVGRRGFTQKGPPYEFDVPKGKRIALEVVRKGYTTRKVTLDGSSSRVVVGLNKIRTPSKR